MNYIVFTSILLTSFSALGLLASVMLTRSTRATSERILEVTFGQRAQSHKRGLASIAFRERLFGLVRWVRSRLGMGVNAKLLERFNQAGFRSRTASDTYFTARLLGPLAALAAAILAPSNRFLWMTVLGGLFYLGPDIILSRIIKRRRERIRRSIPDAIDLLVICVDAGLGLDQAMLRVGHELGASHPQIYEEFMQINREQRAGKLRLDAWQSMADRCKLPEIDGFVNMLMQTERFGTPVARALSTFGDGIRLKRRQRAEELAAKTTVKIIFPLVLFIFPSMFIVLLGPAGINIARGLASTQ